MRFVKSTGMSAQKGGVFDMAELKCGVENCSYNQENYCCNKISKLASLCLTEGRTLGLPAVARTAAPDIHMLRVTLVI